MRRRELLKSCLAAPFLGLFRKKTRSGTKFIVDSRPKYQTGTRFVTQYNHCWRYVEIPVGTKISGIETKETFWCWIPESEYNDICDMALDKISEPSECSDYVNAYLDENQFNMSLKPYATNIYADAKWSTGEKPTQIVFIGKNVYISYDWGKNYNLIT